MSTDFFIKQDRARRKTGLLVFYLFLAVGGIAFSICFAIELYLTSSGSQYAGDPQVWVDVVGIVLLVVCVGSLFKILMLAGGGRVVAEELGGHRLESTSANLEEKRLLNVVEEMAIAAGVPVPDVYLLDDSSVNAFAAGFSPKNAVIGVTRGCLKFLKRDELQGVIGHEFSHILNGDMRLNIRLIGIVHGILLLALIGRTMLRASTNRNSKNNAVFVALGILLFLVGYIGVFFGNLIKAAVSRQREFLADASAVQFTRNPFGLSGALKKIGGLTSGSLISHPKAEVASHMFFAQGVKFSLSSLFATHPPLEERIKQIDPGFDGEFPKLNALGFYNQDVSTDGSSGLSRNLAGSSLSAGQALGFATSASAISNSVGELSAQHVANAERVISSIPPGLAASIREPGGAQSAVFLVFMGIEPQLRTRQIDLISKRVGSELKEKFLALERSGERVTEYCRLPLLELAIPVLRHISVADYRIFRECISEIVIADQEVSISEYVLTVLLFQVLDRVHLNVREPRITKRSVVDLTQAIEIIFSALSQYEESDIEKARAAFSHALSTIESVKPLSFRSLNECSVQAIHQAFLDCEASVSQVKKELIERATNCVLHDGKVTAAEAEILRSFGAVLDCPIPLSFN